MLSKILSTNAVSTSTAAWARVGVEFEEVETLCTTRFQGSVSAVALSDWLLHPVSKRKGRKTCYTFFFFEDFRIYANVSSGASSPVITPRYWLNPMRNEAAILCCVFFCVGSSGLHFDHREFHILNRRND